VATKVQKFHLFRNTNCSEPQHGQGDWSKRSKESEGNQSKRRQTFFRLFSFLSAIGPPSFAVFAVRILNCHSKIGCPSLCLYSLQKQAARKVTPLTQCGEATTETGQPRISRRREAPTKGCQNRNTAFIKPRRSQSMGLGVNPAFTRQVTDEHLSSAPFRGCSGRLRDPRWRI